DIPATRLILDQMNTAVRAQLPPDNSIVSEDRLVPGPDDAPAVPIRIYQPAERPSVLPALLWIHGGGYVLGNVDGDDLLIRSLVRSVNCVIVAVDYRLAPEHPFPAPLEDCYAALKWLAANTAELGVNPERIAIGGASAGGGLTAGLALLTRDRGAIKLVFQLPIYPMVDDTNLAQPSAELPDTLLWTRASNVIGWRSYLGQEPGGADVSPYAAPLRAEDLRGLPPTCIQVGTLDLFLAEDIAYAQRLIAADVPTELHVYPGAFHGFDVFAPTAAVSQQFIADRDAALRRALHG
ncbi:alpha/beta hydrolase, partial [Candidatus Gracilibacteria bacterium]|nr:alpha/beta hydrolase [Candidatus Gracilibacteria bacterium]